MARAVARDDRLRGGRRPRLSAIGRSGSFRLTLRSPIPAWRPTDGSAIENEAYRVSVDPARGGTIDSLLDKRTGTELLRPGEVGNELRVYREYPTHPLFGEGPWHLTPDGRFTSATEFPGDGRRRDVAARPADPDRRPVRRCPALAGDPAVGRHRPGRARDRPARLPIGTTACSGSGSRLRSRAAGRCPRSATASSGDRSGVRTSTSPRSRSRSTIPRTTGSVSGRRRASSSASRASVPGRRASVAGDRHRRGRDPRRSGPRRRGSPARSSRSCDRASHRRSRTTTAIDTACSISIRTCPTSGSRSVAPPRTTSWRAVLEAADPGYRAELDRQLAAQGWARAMGPRGRRCGTPAGADHGPPRRRETCRSSSWPATDAESTVAALEALIADLDDGVDRGRAAVRARRTDRQRSADRTVAILNRGMPGFNVEADGSLYLSLMRSCSGWPSGVWIDPPRRSTPDGANFQFQHWSHRFEYAVAASAGDWREGGIVRVGHEYNNPFETRVLESHPGGLPAHREVPRGRTCVGGRDRPQAGGRRARLAWPRTEIDPTAGVALRVYESSGRATTGVHPHEVAGHLGSAHERPRRGRRRGARDVGDRRSRCGSSRTRSRLSPRPSRPWPRTWAPWPRPSLAGADRAGAARLLGLLAAQQGPGADGLPAGHGADQAVVPQR